MVEPIQSSVLLLAFAAATVTDLWYREVPDWISYMVIAYGLLSGIVVSIMHEAITPFATSLFGFLAAAAVGCTLYYSGQWGGGDGKLIMGVGAVLGLNIGSRTAFVSSGLVNFLLVGVIVSGLYGLLWFLGLAIKHRKMIGSEAKKWLNVPKMKWLQGAAGVLFLVLVGVSFLAPDRILQTIIIALALSTYGLLYFTIIVKLVEKKVLIRKVHPKRLVEGDWIAKDVVVAGKTIWGPKRLGITQQAIEQLKRLAKEHKVTGVYVKEGIPFVPVFLLTYVAILAMKTPVLLLWLT